MNKSTYRKHYKITEYTDRATHYYIVPQHNALIPKCSNSQRVLITLLSSTHDVHSPTHVAEYPLVTAVHARLFTSFIPVTVTVMLRKYLLPADEAELRKPAPVTLYL